MIECPECGVNFRGFRCSCGYAVKALSAPAVVIACAHANCQNPAITRQANANLCLAHDEARFMAEVRQVIRDLELDTTAEKIAYCKNLARKAQRKFAAEGNQDWARAILERIDMGEIVPQYSMELARRALA